MMNSVHVLVAAFAESTEYRSVACPDPRNARQPPTAFVLACERFNLSATVMTSVSGVNEEQT